MYSKLSKMGTSSVCSPLFLMFVAVPLIEDFRLTPAANFSESISQIVGSTKAYCPNAATIRQRTGHALSQFLVQFYLIIIIN